MQADRQIDQSEVTIFFLQESHFSQKTRQTRQVGHERVAELVSQFELDLSLIVMSARNMSIKIDVVCGILYQVYRVFGSK